MITKKYYKLIRVSHEDSAYMRLKNVSNEAGIFKMVKSGNPTAPNLEYSLDGVTWTTYDFTTLPEVTVSAGANIYFRGTNSNQQFNRSSSNYVKFSFSKTCEGHGNICSLFNPDPAVFSAITSVGDYGLCNCFAGCTSLTIFTDTSNLTSIGGWGLYKCFAGCTSLTTFTGFSSLTYAYAASVRECFAGCTSLEEGPDFRNITSVDSGAIGSCFEGCSKLSNVTTPNIQNLTTDILSNWLQRAGTSATGTKTVNVPAGATIETGSDSGIPTGWTRVDY